MKTVNRILFPVDLTESSDKLVPHVTAMVHKFEAQLHLLFVVRIFQYFSSIYVPHPSINLFESELLEGARRRMNEFHDSHFKALPDVIDEVILGDASETILEYIANKQIDMVIMGTHGRKGLDRVIFGSVAERVIKSSPVPVLVVNPYKIS